MTSVAFFVFPILLVIIVIVLACALLRARGSALGPFLGKGRTFRLNCRRQSSFTILVKQMESLLTVPWVLVVPRCEVVLKVSLQIGMLLSALSEEDV